MVGLATDGEAPISRRNHSLVRFGCRDGLSIIRVLTQAFGPDHERIPLMPGSPSLRGVLPTQSTVGYQLKSMDTFLLVWGGAVEYAHTSLNIPYLQWKGRWANPKTMVHDLQMSVGVHSYAQVGQVEKPRILALARLAPRFISEPCDTQSQREFVQSREEVGYLLKKYSTHPFIADGN
eukprot:2066608-Amphidinium_carterae.3